MTTANEKRDGRPHSETSTEKSNRLYAEWKTSPGEETFSRLRDALFEHAERVVWLVLRKADHLLANELVNDLLMKLSQFKGQSKFSSWAHSAFRNGCIYDSRQERRVTGSALQRRLLNRGTPAEMSIDAKLDFESLLNALPDRERTVVEMRIDGYRLADIMNRTGLSRTTIYEILQDLNERKYFSGGLRPGIRHSEPAVA